MGNREKAATLIIVILLLNLLISIVNVELTGGSLLISVISGAILGTGGMIFYNKWKN